MLITKKTSVGGEYYKKGEDVRNGDKITILNSGDITTGEYGEQTVFKIRTPKGDEKNAAFNQTTLNTLHDAFGADSDLWKGQDVVAHAIKMMVSGKLRDVYYFAPVGWEMDNDGRFYDPSGDGRPAVPSEDDLVA